MPIVFEDVYAGYRRGEYVLKGVTCRLEPPTIILGPNGAGKTTMFRVVLGLTPVARGRVELDGVEVDRIRGRPGLVATNLEEVHYLLHLNARDTAKLYLDLLGGDYSVFERLVREFKVDHALGRKLYKLSAGEKRMVLNFIALASEARYLLLDEPFENLDPRARAKMLQLILENAERVIMNTHATWLLERLEGWKAYIMVAGRVYGPLDASEMPRLGVVEGREVDAVVTIEVEGRQLSLVRGRGAPLSKMDSLDRLYEVIAG